MSSDGSEMSNSSGIRQFGLYRSIDARTQEFLRASRKRQIRQGCVCAAVSTAITVTVVISVILVYEYSINGESNTNRKLSLKPNWVGLMNDSTHVTQLDTKFTKKINIDKTTMKLLPILIKALNTNRYLEKILADYSSTSPANDRKYTTEFAFNKNVFDKKQWIKMPTSRLYTSDYKSSPALLKVQAQNLDFFRTRKKLKDYQRMLNYFDKMVGDKVGSMQPVITNVFESTKRPISKYTLPIKSHKYQSTIKHQTTTVIVKKVDDKKEKSNCKCPNNLGQMLSKLINNLKETIPNFIATNSSVCANKTSTITTTPRVFVNSRQTDHTLRNPFIKTTSESITPKVTRLIQNFMTTKYNACENKTSTTTTIPKVFVNSRQKDYTWWNSFFKTTTESITTKIPQLTQKNIATKSSAYENKTSITTIRPRVFVDSRQRDDIWRNSFIKTTAESIIPKITRLNTESSTYSSTGSNIIFHKMFFPEDEVAPLTTNFKGDYNRYYSFHGNKIMTPTRLDTTENVMPEKLKTLPITTDHLLHKVTLTPVPYTSTTNTRGKRTKAPVTKRIPLDYEYDYYLFTTRGKKVVNKIDKFDVKYVLTKKQSFSEENEPQVYRHSYKKLGKLTKPFDPFPSVNKKDFINTRKIKDNIINLPPTKYNEHVSTTTETDVTESHPSHVTPYHVLTPPKKAGVVNLKRGNKIADKIGEVINLTKYDTKLQGSWADPESQGDAKVNQEIFDNIMTDIDLGKVLPEDEFQEQLSTKLIENTIDAPTKYNNKSKSLDLWDILNHNNNPTRSMLPPIRPVNLEFQRNSDWRHENQHDYDSNYNNNVFDIPNI